MVCGFFDSCIYVTAIDFLAMTTLFLTATGVEVVIFGHRPIVFGSLSGAGQSRAASKRRRVIKWMGKDRLCTASSNSNAAKLWSATTTKGQWGRHRRTCRSICLLNLTTSHDSRHDDNFGSDLHCLIPLLPILK